MKKVLIYSIFRNSEDFLETYYKQVKAIVKSFPEIEFYFSAYENDSSDNTPEILQAKDWSFFKDYSVVCKRFGARPFGSTKEEERVRNLSRARNVAISAKGFIDKVDYVMMIECDMEYDMQAVEKILNFDKKEDFDIVSGFTYQIVEGSWYFYDMWATRSRPAKEFNEKYNAQPFWDLAPNWRTTEYARYYSTSNGICLYKAKPFQEGIRYGYISTSSKISDCDTAVVCEEFILSGYNNIFIIHDALIEHKGDQR